MKNGIDNANCFMEKLQNREKPISTGFSELDKCLNGGLTPNLYVIGAMSSVGKTTFSLQIADYIASQEIDVFIFSIEMTEFNLTAKSLSRLSEAENSPLSYEEILLQENTQQVEALLDVYKEKIASHIYICDTLVSVVGIEKEIKNFLESQNKKPVVIIDYLQIIDTSGATFTSDKQRNDFNIGELHRISKAYQVPIWVISAVNRSSYNKEGIAMDSFKESGQIEYEADILIGLNKQDSEIVTLQVLKNRNGETGKEITYSFEGKYSKFEEHGF